MSEKMVCDCEVIHEDIVGKVKGQMPDAKDFLALANLYKMFSDSTRVKILWALNCNEMCVCDLAFLLNMTKSAVSHQLKSLRFSNLVKFRRQGQMVFYSLLDNHVKSVFEQGFTHILKGCGR